VADGQIVGGTHVVGLMVIVEPADELLVLLACPDTGWRGGWTYRRRPYPPRGGVLYRGLTFEDEQAAWHGRHGGGGQGRRG
jgi:hypothetical protein